eukprot:Hpha_TRINITY_DN10728_c0_g1::TRINITY_DN10728_c0_g1_i1::g.43640::m.43640
MHATTTLNPIFYLSLFLSTSFRRVGAILFVQGEGRGTCSRPLTLGGLTVLSFLLFFPFCFFCSFKFPPIPPPTRAKASACSHPPPQDGGGYFPSPPSLWHFLNGYDFNSIV